MRVVVGLELRGTTLTACDDRGRRRASVGDVAWSPLQFLRDLELRLGIVGAVEPHALRVASWQERLATLPPSERFYSRSLEADPLGTAEALLALRDSLVESGWQGQDVPAGGERLHALAEIEQHSGPPLPAGYGDRLGSVERALSAFTHRIYDEIALAEPASHWPQRWQRTFESLARAGTRLACWEPTLPGASRDGDLRRIQAALERSNDAVAPIEGDGSLVLLTAETSWEAAHATAAILAELDAEQTVVIREGDDAALDHALAALGQPTQGLRARSPWRSALQILPLALELAFEPRDPCRVLELLGVHGGPFQGRAGRKLARALAKSPGVGSPAWEDVKTTLASDGLQRPLGPGNDAPANDAPSNDIVRRIADWLEGPAADPIAGAAKAMLFAVVERVHAWLLSRIAGSPEDGALLAAANASAAFRKALERDPRERLDLLAVRKLSTMTLGAGSGGRSLPEQSGRLDHVDRASGLVVPRENVVWWFFVDAGRRPPRLPWRRDELRALSAIGVRFPDSRQRLLELARQRRRALRCATGRVVLVAPRASSRDRLALDPLWHEIQALAGLDEGARQRLTLDARTLLARPTGVASLPLVKRTSLTRTPLPGGHVEWNIGAIDGLSSRSFSPSSSSALLGCPLRWVLAYAARFKSARLALPPLHRLAGTLGHRLVEVLHGQGAFDGPETTLAARASAQLEELIRREGALLSRPGMSFERAQVTQQLVHAVIELARSLRRAQLHIVGVERELRMPWRGGQLEGRVDLLVADPSGSEHILDLKWGASSYREALAEGRALQLAAYTALQAHGREHPVEAAFFTLKRGKLIGLAASALPIDERVRGPSLTATWASAERSMSAVEARLVQGRVPVSGLRRSLPLLDALGVEPSQQPRYFSVKREAICEYCDFDALCGRRWEAAHGRD
jgi:ATP-dependent helicase/nuclease subunit B